jgi:hypothetical protein
MTLYQLTFTETPFQNHTVICESKKRMVVNEENEDNDEVNGRGLF